MTLSFCTAIEVVALVICCFGGNEQPESTPRARGKQNANDYDEKSADTESEMSIEIWGEEKQMEVHVETVPPPYKEATDLSLVQIAAKSRCSHLSIAHPKYRRSFMETKTVEKAAIDPRDAEAARLAELEEEEHDVDYIFKKGTTTKFETEEMYARPSRMRRLRSKLSSDRKGAKA